MHRHGSIPGACAKGSSPSHERLDPSPVVKDLRLMRGVLLHRLARWAPSSPFTNTRLLLVAVTLVVMVVKLRWAAWGGETLEATAESIVSESRELQEAWGPVAVVLLPSPVVGPGSRADRLQAIHETWGSCLPPRLLQVLVATDDPAADSPPSLALPASAWLRFPPQLGPEADGLRRLGWVLSEALQRVPGLSFVVLANDHTFLLPTNLLAFLRASSDSPATDKLYLGHRLQIDPSTVFHSGAAGTVLSRAVLEPLLQALEEGGQDCSTRNQWESANAGVVLAGCLRRRLGVEATDTAVGGGSEHRFNVYGPARMANGEVDDWYVRYHGGEQQQAVAAGRECCAAEVVSFHYVGPGETRALWHVLHSQQRYVEQQQAGAGPQQLAEAAHWPLSAEALGGYSRPPVSAATWDLLLHKITLLRRRGLPQPQEASSSRRKVKKHRG